MITTTNIFGFHFICNLSYKQVADLVVSDLAAGNAGITNLITPNANGINVYAKYPELERFCRSSRYVLPDGQPIVWLSKLTKHPIQQRLTGSDFFPVMFQRIKGPHYKSLFVVSNQTIEQALRKEKPDAAFLVPDFFEMSDEDTIDALSSEMASLILRNKIQYVFTGISDPKQVALAQETSKKLREQQYTHGCVFFLLGASFEFYLGMKKRAPVFFQSYGLEWFYRLMMEPKRMFKRYVIGNFIFILRSFKWMLLKR